MSVYQVLARHYDALTDDVPYEDWADFLEKIFKRHKCAPKLILDVACGTGSVSVLLAQRGYEVIGVDSSPEMLACAQQKAAGSWNAPFFINQTMTGLNLYGTVDAAVSCLDSINYLTAPGELLRALKRISLFINPGGLFIFDLNTKEKLCGLDGEAYIRETGGLFCAWRAAWSEKSQLCRFDIDLFENMPGRGYERFTETHKERAYSREEISEALATAGLKLEKIYGELTLKPPGENEQRVFVVARKPK